ncbi:glycosyltransferase family 2 protein [Candidatus Woesebacteria bacterium]|nr:glycosyltransferase family 2 protein [Candidatus Woesebacteria bacterium]
MIKISVVINTLNEEKNLPRALNSVKYFADEIVVVDMHSVDNTAEIAEEAGAKVFEHRKMGYVEPARNFAIGKAKGEWIMILDADEEINQSLCLKLRKIAEEKNCDYVAIPRKNIVFGKWLKHSRWWPDYNVRFFRKGKVKWDDKIHSIPETSGKGIDLKAKEDNAIIHHNYNSISQFVQRMDRYTTVQSRELLEQGYKFDWRDLIKQSLGEFISRYFKGYGYKDGVHGLAVSLLQSISEALVYMKVWEANGFKERSIEIDDMVYEMRGSQREMNYWIANLKVNQKNSLIERIRRKLKV